MTWFYVLINLNSKDISFGMIDNSVIVYARSFIKTIIIWLLDISIK